MERRYAIYKGLQRPLIFKGFKGKFIYWGAACLLSALVLGALAMSLVNMYLGVTILTGCLLGGMFYISGKQKRGLHEKTRSRGIYICPPQLKNIKRYGPKTSI